MLTHLVVAAVDDAAVAAMQIVAVAIAAAVAVEFELLIDYVVMIVVNFVQDSLERNHFVELETVAGIVAVIENRSFGLSLLNTNKEEKIDFVINHITIDIRHG